MSVLGHAALNAVSLLLAPAPSREEIQVQLDRILSSPEFVVPPRARAFLSYVVEETLAGRAARIKGYSIAIEVFGRDAGFTQDDPVVRIEAGRLRRALERYFLVAGQADPIRVEIPLGRYVPVFAWSVSSPSALPEPAAVEPAAVEPAAMPGESKPPWLSWERAHWLATGALALVAGLTSIAYWSSSGSVSEASPPSVRVADSDGPTLVVAPFADLGEGPQAKVYAIGLTEELLSVLPRFKELTVMGRETSEALTSQADPSHVREKLGAHYLLTGGVQVSGARIRVTSRLTDTEDGAILWSQTYNDDLRSRDIFAIQSDVAAQVATVVAQPYGVIYQADMANAPPDDLDAYRCTLQFYAYRAALSAELHGAVRGCLERAVALYPNYVTAWSMLSIAYLDEDRFGFNQRSGSPTSVERSLAAARRAVDLDPRNVRALQALMTALFFNNQLAESMEVGEKALVLNPNDTEFLGEFGTRLASGGQWQRGAKLLQEALSRNPGGSGYYHAMLALTAHMLGDDGKALSEIRQANVTNLPLVHLIAAIIYAQNGRADDAHREGAIFVKLRPDFLPNIRAELTKRNFQPDDQVKMIAGLRKAGLLPL
jgi:TolB-like protein